MEQLATIPAVHISATVDLIAISLVQIVTHQKPQMIQVRIFFPRIVKLIELYFAGCPLNCSPGYCVRAGAGQNAYACMCNGTLTTDTCVRNWWRTMISIGEREKIKDFGSSYILMGIFFWKWFEINIRCKKEIWHNNLFTNDEILMRKEQNIQLFFYQLICFILLSICSWIDDRISRTSHEMNTRIS